MNPLLLLPCLDSDERAARCREVLLIPRNRAAELGRTAVAAAETGAYRNAAGRLVDWGDKVARACAAKRSLPPEAQLPDSGPARFPQTRVQVANETTLVAALVLGAWGCGAFGNDPERTARDFKTALGEQAGAFADVVFAISDWSPERRYLGPFRDLLASDSERGDGNDGSSRHARRGAVVVDQDTTGGGGNGRARESILGSTWAPGSYSDEDAHADIRRDRGRG